MKTCPNCREAIQDSFDLCWKCNYSFIHNNIIEPRTKKNPNDDDLNCLRCNITMIFSGTRKFHEGARTGVFGEIGELFVKRQLFDLYHCPKCGKIEFFAPVKIK